MFDGKVLNVHEALKDLHGKATVPPLCGEQGFEGLACLIYCSCGSFEPDEPCGKRCPFPCKHCLIWEGYAWDDGDMHLLRGLLEKAYSTRPA